MFSCLLPILIIEITFSIRIIIIIGCRCCLLLFSVLWSLHHLRSKRRWRQYKGHWNISLSSRRRHSKWRRWWRHHSWRSRRSRRLHTRWRWNRRCFLTKSRRRWRRMSSNNWSWHSWWWRNSSSHTRCRWFRNITKPCFCVLFL